MIMICDPNECGCFVSMMVLLVLMNLGNGGNECRDMYCDPNECGSSVQIRFPFQLVDGMTNHCGCPGFRLSCINNSVIMLELPSIPDPIRLPVNYIDYESQLLGISDPESCLPILFLKLFHSSIHPFQFYSYPDSETPTNITFFDCSSTGWSDCPTFAADSDDSVDQAGVDLVSCSKKSEIVSPVSTTDLLTGSLILKWSKPKCDVENFYCNHKPTNISTIILAVTGSIGLLLLLLAVFQIYRYFRMKGEDQARVEKFLKDYKALNPTRFSYADLKRITNNFKDKLGEGAHGAIFKGKVSSEIVVAVKMLNNSEGDGKDFINEVGTMGKIHHINVVRLLGFCADGFRRALVYAFFPNGSLQNFISTADNKDSFLGWDKLQKIALGMAKGIEYLHHDCDHRILHFDINPNNVLLDHNFTPKISDFGLAKLCSKNRSTVSMTAARGTLGYIAPEVFFKNFGNVSYKSDIYSYGMLLIEMVGGKKNISTGQESFEILYPEWIHNLVEGRDIHIHIEDEDIRIAKKLAIVGLWCIQWHPMNRPSMKTVVQMLEGEGDNLKVPPVPFDSTTSTSTSTVIPTRRLNLELEVIYELE